MPPRRRSVWVALAALALLCPGVSATEMKDNQTTLDDFNRFAEQMPYLTVPSVLYHRPDGELRAADPAKAKLQQELYRRVCDESYPVDMLETLCVTGNPKVQTLAAVALYERDEPSECLYSISRLCESKAPTFDGSPSMVSNWRTPEQAVASMQKQTVGGFATALIRFYLDAAGTRPQAHETTADTFRRYQAAHQDCDTCASWLSVELARVGGGSLPTAPDRVPAVEALGGRIKQLPAPDRAWTLLALQGEYGAEHLATEAELVEMCRQVGPRQLMRMLQGGILSQDPDVQPGTPRYDAIRSFVLRHATQVLRPTDWENVLDCEEPVPAYEGRTSLWVLAAARLSPPERGIQILSDALPRFQDQHHAADRAAIYEALWTLAGAAQSPAIADWFFDDSTKFWTVPEARKTFIRALWTTTPHGRVLLASLLLDPRLEKLCWPPLLEAAYAMVEDRQPTTAALFSLDDIRRVEILQSEAQNGQEPAKAALQKEFEQWRAKIKTAAPQWSREDDPSAIQGG